MALHMSLLVIFNMIQTITSKFTIPHDAFNDQIDTYCSKIGSTYKIPNMTYGLLNIGGPTCDSIANTCLKSCNCVVTVQNLTIPVHGYIVFVDDVTNKAFIGRSRIRKDKYDIIYHIIYCSEVSHENITQIAIQSWNRDNMLFSVFVYSNNSHLNLISYDKYTPGGPFLNFSDAKDALVKRRRSIDTSAYLLDENYPVIRVEDGKLTGEYIELMDAVEVCLGTQLTYKTSAMLKSVSTKELLTYKYDPTTLMILKTVMYTDNYKHIITYPLNMENFVVLVPFIEQDELYYIFKILGYGSVLCFIVILLGMSILNSNLTKGYNTFSFGDILFDYFGSFLGLPVERFEVKKSFVLLSWIVFSLIITVYIKGVLLDNIFQMKNQRFLNTIEELKQHKSNVYVSLSMKNIKEHENGKYLGDQMKFSMSTVIIDSIKNNLPNAYVVTETTAKGFLILRERHLIKFNYKIMNEPLASFLMAFPMNAYSKLADEINTCLLRARDVGVIKSSFASSIKRKDYPDNQMLTPIHFVGTFILLFIGYAISFVVFLIEVGIGKFKDRREAAQVIKPFVN